MDTKLVLEEALNDCLSKANKSNDPEEFKNYIEGSVKIANSLTEIKKNENLQELEKKKYEESKNWKDPKFLIPIIVPSVFMICMKIMDERFQWKVTKEVCYFELNNTFTTQAGKGLAGALRFPAIKR